MTKTTLTSNSTQTVSARVTAIIAPLSILIPSVIVTASVRLLLKSWYFGLTSQLNE